MGDATGNNDSLGVEEVTDLHATDSVDNRYRLGETFLLVLLFFVYAGDLPPMVNEAHYLVKAKNFWQPDWCANDLFAASSKAHTTFYVLFGWTTNYFSFPVAAWIGRVVGWVILAIGLQRLCWVLFGKPLACLAVAVLWIAGIEYGNLAGEWVVGGIEAKVPAYGFVLLGLSYLVCRDWNRAWICMGLASAFHVLSGGWSVIAALVAFWFSEHGQADAKPLFTPSLFIGGAISLFGLVPAVGLTLGADTADSTAAANIYTYVRISHHLLPANFLPAWYLRHFALILMIVVVAGLYWRRCDRIRRFGWFTVGALSIAAAGLAVGALPAVMPNLAAKLLRYYWFRLSDAIVPLMFAALATQLLLDQTRRFARLLGMAALLAGIGLVGYSSYQKSVLGVPPSISNALLGRDADASAKAQQQIYRDWLAVCRWARTSTSRDEVFLTPRHQQTFKWYADRAEVVNWKDVPQDAKSLHQWYRRFLEVFPKRLGSIRVSIEYPTLWKFREKYGVRYMIVDRRVTGKNLPLVRLYPTAEESNDNFAVYELPLP